MNAGTALLDRFRRRTPARLASVQEAYRTLRSSVVLATEDLPERCIVVTSSNPQEGKTVTSVHLAKGLANAGERVVLIDFDLRRPTTHEWLDIPNGPGAMELLAGLVTVPDVATFVPVAGDRGMYVITAGNEGGDPAGLATSPRLTPLLTQLSQQADYVIVDSAPVLPVADTLSIARHASGVLLVVEAGRTDIRAAQRARDLLIRNQARLLGLVVNRVSGPSAYGYGYGSYDRMYEEAGQDPAGFDLAPANASS